jgi:hypothetical protein
MLICPTGVQPSKDVNNLSKSTQCSLSNRIIKTLFRYIPWRYMLRSLHRELHHLQKPHYFATDST